MKRARDPSTSTSARSTTKRPKSIQACLSCRKHKTRCEVLDVASKAIRCHRCKTLDIQCSYEEMDRAVLITNTVKAQCQAHGLSMTSNDKGVNRFDEWALGLGQTVSDSTGTGASGSGTHTSPSSSGANEPSTSETSESSRPTHTLRPGPHIIWNYLSEDQFGPLDWSAPLEAMQILTKNPSKSSSSTESLPSSAGDSLDGILSPVHKAKLLQIFHDNYSPWLNFNLIRSAHNPLLDLVCCTVACRHIERYERSFIEKRLHALTQDSSAKLIFQSRRAESLEATQCLLILSLWAPVSGVSEEHRDGKLLIASAVSMAMNLRLNEAPQKVLAMQQIGKFHILKMVNILIYSSQWIAISSAERLLCIGSGREALSKRDPDYLSLFPIREEIPTDEIRGRDVRLRMLADLYDVTEKAFSIKFTSHTENDVNTWYHETEHARSEFSRIGRLILPLGVVAQTDKFYFRIVNTIAKSCRLLVLYHATVIVRIYFHTNPNIQDAIYWFRAVRPYNNNVLLTWGKESLHLAEAVLVDLLELDIHQLGTAPDHFFLMISFAASFLVGVKFMMYQGIGHMLPGSSDTLLTMCIAHLHRAAYTSDHSASLCANVISELVDLWKDKEAVTKQQKVLPVPATYDRLPGPKPGSFKAYLDSTPNTTAPLPVDPTISPSMDWSWLNDPFWNDVLNPNASYMHRPH
uniref:Zn(2)-C6 fungal-type domain-containing protein n=1 Tax=Moniliophthora roreri TaxID=221103 RepID=A0A0W0FM46_MONRR